jgi:parallel beta-helix repeat protein
MNSIPHRVATLSTILLAPLLALNAAAGTLYVDLNSTNPVSPYSDWSTAATNIQDAVDAAGTGDLVLVKDGIYQTGGRAVYGAATNRVAITKAVTVRSVNGPMLTIVAGAAGSGGTNGNGAIRCVYVGTNAVLSGFTLTNGFTRTTGDLSKERSGGGVWCETTGLASNCVMSGNSASQYGGGAFQGTIINCTFTGNSATAGGGASSNTLNNCTLRGNSGFWAGGANYCNMTRCTLVGNSASDEGGGAYYSTLNNCTLSGNSASDEGGGACGGTLYNCTLSGNYARYGGGANSAVLNNCILSDNSAYSGGGAALTYGGTLNNCTVTGNSAESGAAGVDGGPLRNGGTLNNCIVYYNSGPNWSLVALNYCCTTPVLSGPGNIDSEPLLASSSHLSALSPCIARGSSAYTNGVDIDGESWLNPPCMGADQLVTNQATGQLAMAIAAPSTNAAPGITLSFAGQNSGRIAASAWDFGDGVVVSNQPYVSHAWSAPGLYTVRLTGYNDSWPAGVSATVQVQVGTREVYYVNGSNAAPVYPYTDWAGAAVIIQEAIDAGTQLGRLVLVADGVYGSGGRALWGQMTNRVVVPTSVEIRSVNGPLVTYIAGGSASGGTNGDGAIRCVYVGFNAVVSGFTLTNGHTRAGGDVTKEQSGGAAWCELSGAISNCTVSGNSALSCGGGAYQGTLYNCTLTGNSSVTNGGGAYKATLYNCTMASNSAASYGGGVFQSALNNCTLVGNAAWTGGGAYYATLTNCIAYDNSARYGTNCSSSTLRYCCTTPLSAVPGNFTNAPLFVNEANGNFRLQATSACINAGANPFAPAGLDLDGNPRISGGTVDVGAYEFQNPASAISYAWLQQYGLQMDGTADTLDSDHDGLNNWQEWRAGTDPMSASSVLQMLAPTNGASGVTVMWQSVTNRSYYLQRSVDLSAQPPFVNVQSNIVGQAGLTSYTDTNAAGAGPFFYWVGVQ